MVFLGRKNQGGMETSFENDVSMGTLKHGNRLVAMKHDGLSIRNNDVGMQPGFCWGCCWGFGWDNGV